MARIKANAIRDAKGIPRSALPKAPPQVATAQPPPKPMRMAALPQPDKNPVLQVAQVRSKPGFVLDYTQINTASNVTFKADTTYYVSGTIALYGTNRLEGGTVIKFAPTNSALIILYGPPPCLTPP